MLAAGEFVFEKKSKLIFSPLVAWAGVAFYIFIAIGLILSYFGKHTALMEPVNPQFRAIMNGAGVFIGVLLAAVIHDVWALGFNMFRPVPKGIFAALQLMALVIASFFGGGYVADLWTEWRAFHGLHPLERVEAFFVVQHHSMTRAPDWLDLRNAPGSEKFSIGCGWSSCYGVRTGSWIQIPVQTGRGGLRRAVLPLNSRDTLLQSYGLLEPD